MQPLREFIQQYPLKKFPKNELVLQQNEQPSVVYAIRQGSVKAYDINSQGIEQQIWFGITGDIFPLPYLFSSAPSSELFYSAFDYLEVYAINKQELVQFLRDNATALFYTTRLLSDYSNDLLKRLNATEKPKAEEKLVHTLVFLAERFSVVNHREQSSEITLPLTHQDIASLLGLTRETVAMELKRLKDKDYIYYDKWHFVVFQDKLLTLM